MTPRSQPPTELAAGDVIAGKFRLERVVGRGGMGSVWAARHVQLGMPVALKFIETEEGGDVADARARFEREARAAGQLRSPHVVQILDHGVDDDRPYIAMELLEGEDLGERLRRDGRVGVAAMAKILTQCAKALRRAHDAGIIHRDLKPGNVFLARFDDDEVVKVLDFGVAKLQRAGALEGHQGTQTGIVFGSPSYMSPEQARGVRAIDHRSDLWSLAVIAFRGVTGVKPFQAASIGEMVIKLCIDPLPVATSFAPDLSPEIDAFFARAFARDPDQRFASAPEMAAAFEAAAAAGAVSAPPASRSRPSLQGGAVPPGSSRPVVGRTPPSGARAAPASSRSSAPGSGPQVAFAPGTLTPPPGTSGGALDIPPAAPSARASVTPPSWGALPPTAGAMEVPSAPPAPPAPSASASILEGGPARASSDRRIAIRAGVGAVALGLVLVALLVVARRVGSDAGGPVAVAAPQPPAVTAPPPETAQPQPPPVVTAAPSASASAPPEPTAAASAEPSASAEPEAEPTGAPSALPTRLKPGKKRRPNFGY